HPAPIERPAIRVRQWLAVIADHLKAPQHPAGLLTAAAELPPTGDPVAACHRRCLPAARHRGPGDDRVGSVSVNLLDAVVRKAQRHQLTNATIAEVPAD